MKRTPLTGITARWAAGLLIAAGLALGLGVQSAAAEEEIGAPTVQSLRLEAPDANVTVTDNSAVEPYFFILLRERDQPDRHVFSWSYGAVPGEGRVATRSIRGITLGVAYCATVTAYRSSTVFEDLDLFRDTKSRESNAVCADPARQAAAPDLALEKVSGREEREWAVVAGQAPAYLVVLRNDGADANGTVVVDIATSGVARLAEQLPVVRQGWEAAGFTCATRAPAGGETAGLRCTGGSLKRGERINPAILVRFTGRDYGYIHVSIGVSGGPAEVGTSDNRETLGIRVS